MSDSELPRDIASARYQYSPPFDVAIASYQHSVPAFEMLSACHQHSVSVLDVAKVPLGGRYGNTSRCISR